MAEKTFEQSMNQLEKIVKALEAGDLPLEKALEKFEQGVKLSKSCADKLDKIEQKVTLLLQDQEGEAVEKPFLEGDEGE